MTAARFVVRGRVQGVFFRAASRREARRLAVTGWVRNRSDGTVEVFAQGAPDAVEELAAFLAAGPPHAVVAAVERGVAEPDASLHDFEIRSS